MNTDLDIPQNIISDVMSHHALHSPMKTALVVGNRRISWGEMNSGINRVANRLLADGIEKGDRICFVMATSVEYFYLMFGAMKAGAMAVPLSAMLSSDQLAGLIDDAGAKLLFTDEVCRPLLTSVESRLATVRVEGFFSTVENGHWRSIEDWLAGASEKEPPLRLMMDDDATISYSSGTTGLPKGIVYSHRARLHLGIDYAVHMHIDSGSTCVATTPLYSNGTSIMMFPALFSGGTLVLMESFDTRAFLEVVDREKATHTMMVPTQFIKLLAEPAFDDYDISSMRVFCTCGSPMRRDLKRIVLERLGPRLSELYGLSEGGVTMIRPDEMATRLDSVGTPLPGFELRVLDMEGNELPRGQIGELAFYGGWAMRRYHNQPERTAETIWRDARGRSFIRTGDIGRMDDDGYVYVVDRKKDMIISGGFNVFPADIEAVVGEHPAVEDVAVVGIGHPLWGESPVAAVRLRPHASAQPEEIRAWCNARLAKSQRLAKVILRMEFPRNALGKVLKPALRDEYRDLLTPPSF